MRLVASLACALFVSSTTAALAQPSSGTVFISAGGFAAIEKAPTASGGGLTESDPSGTVAGGMLGIGVHLTERVSARFEGSRTDALKQSQGYGLFPALEGLGGRTSIVEPRFDATRSTTAGFVLLGYHLPAGRASVELLGGVGLLNSDVTTRYDVRILNLPGPSSEYSNSTYHAVAVVGADIAVSLTAHAAVVPQVRAYALGGGLSLRPGLSLRWTF